MASKTSKPRTFRNFVRHEAEVPAYGTRPRRTITAASTVVTPDHIRRLINTQAWQADAWRYFKVLGPVGYGVDWLANSCSRARLYVGRIDPRGDSSPTPVDDERINGVLDAFAGGQSGQAQILHRMVTHLSVPGEDYLIAWEREGVDGKPVRRWAAATTDEIKKVRDGLQLTLDDESTVTIDPAKDLVIRVWRQDPQFAWEATSPMRGVLRDCKVLCALDAHILATADSRLKSAGIMTIPEGATIAPASPRQAADEVHDDPFMAELVTTMAEAIEDPGSTAGLVPIVLRLPDGTEAHLLDPSSKFDAQVPVLVELGLRKLAVGLDMPPEVLAGTGQTSNHWGAWQVDEQSIKVNIRPILHLICNVLTIHYLHPTLTALDIDPTGLVIYADTSELQLRPNRSQEAIELYRLGAIGADTLRRECGFGEADAPTEKELQHQLLVQLAATPAGAQMVAQALGLNIRQQTPDTPPTGTAPTATPPLPAGPASPRALPEQAAARVASAEPAVLRALEIAGKRLLDRTSRGRYTGVKPWTLHTHIRASSADLDRLLTGAWDTLSATGSSREEIAALDRYTRRLIATGTAHSRAALVAALKDRP